MLRRFRGTLAHDVRLPTRRDALRTAAGIIRERLARATP
jgi:hypothetical protein